jgi:DNA-binding SARP family transcriptional activator/tetratricopeptide (TPR) repeat protein
VDVTFGILGRTALRIAGTMDESWGRPRERAVLATLLIHAGQPVSIDRLVEWVWPEETPTPQKPMMTFHTYATRIRKSLQHVEVPVALVAEDGCYRLDVDRSHIDYDCFKLLMAEVHGLLREGRAMEASKRAQRAITLWRGSPLMELRTERARNWRQRVLANDWLPANTTLLETWIELGEHTSVLAHVDNLLAEYPNELALIRVRMAALHGLARHTDATTYFLNTYRSLREESDSQTAEQLRHYHDSITSNQVLQSESKPRPPAAAAVPRQLPHDIADFVGRAELLQALDTATRKPSGEPGGGVVILDGMPGVGKTTLAVHWGHLTRHRFPDGDLFINLNGFAEGAVVPQSRVIDDFLIALGHPPDKSLDQHSRELLLSQLLANSSTLVVLDNARNTTHVKDLIALLPSCLVIVTSRQRLSTLSATTAARRVRVEPMPIVEATELLSARLANHRTIDFESRARLARLCGGLPLVISVLAEHVATLGMAQLSTFAKQIDRRQLIAEVGEDGDGSAVGHTFFSWSYQRLAPPEQRLFRLLGLHPGPDIGMDVACACDGRTATETKRSFGKLVAAHLLELPIVFDRYRFHDLLREFAIYCAERDEPPDSRSAAERRMLSFYLRSAAHADRVLYPYRNVPIELPMESKVEPAIFANAAQAKFWFDLERTNLTAAVHFAATHGHHNHAYWLADAVSSYFDRHGYYHDSREVRKLAVSAARAVKYRNGEMSSLEGLGMVHLILGDDAQAQQCLDTALRYAEDDANERAQATTLHHLGRLAMQRGHPAKAVDLYTRSLDVAQLIDDQGGQCWTHCRIAEALRLLHRADQALLHLHQARWFAERIGDRSALASSLATIGSIYCDKGDYDAAQAHAEQALRIAEAIPDLASTVQVCTILAEITCHRGDAAAATRYARHAVDLCHQTHNVSAEARSREVLGDVQFATGNTTEAAEAWRHSADLYDRTANPARMAIVRAKINNLPVDDLDLPTARTDSTSPTQG